MAELVPVAPVVVHALVRADVLSTYIHYVHIYIYIYVYIYTLHVYIYTHTKIQQYIHIPTHCMCLFIPEVANRQTNKQTKY